MGEFLILTPASIDASLVVTVVRPLFQTNAFHDPFPTNLIENKQNYSTVSSSLSSFKTKKSIYIHIYIFFIYCFHFSFPPPSLLPLSTNYYFEFRPDRFLFFGFAGGILITLKLQGFFGESFFVFRDSFWLDEFIPFPRFKDKFEEMIKKEAIVANLIQSYIMNYPGVERSYDRRSYPSLFLKLIGFPCQVVLVFHGEIGEVTRLKRCKRWR